MASVSSRRIGETRDWELPDSYDGLGLGYAELSSVLRNLPESWSEQTAASLAVAVHTTVSAMIGSMASERQSIPAINRALAGMCAVQVIRELSPTALEHDRGLELLPGASEDEQYALELSPWPEWSAPETQDALRRSHLAGWGSVEGPWRRLAGRTFDHVVQVTPATRRSITIRDARDFAALDKAWSAARTVPGGKPRLPLPLCAAFLPPERVLALDDLDEPLTVVVPSGWQLLAQLILWRPESAEERLIAWIADKADEELPGRIDRPDGGRRTEGTLDALVTHAARWLLRIHDVAAAFPDLLDAWRAPVAVNRDRIAEGVAVYSDRTAIPRWLFRRALAEAGAEVDRFRRPDGTLKPGCFRHLRFKLALGLLGDLSCHPAELAAIVPARIRRNHVFRDPETGLTATVTMVQITPVAKGSPRKGRPRNPQPRWKAIHETTAADLDLWLALNGITDDDPKTIWPVFHNRSERASADQLSAFLTGTVRGGQARIARLTGRAYTADNVRHLGAQVAQSVGHDWLTANPTMESRISPSAFSEAQLAHEPRSDMLGYMDVKRRPELWAARAALGANGVPGLLARLHDDAGARLGWDTAEIQRLALAHELASSQLDAKRRQITRLELEDRAHRDAPISPRIPKEPLPPQHALELMLNRDAAREARDATRNRIADELKHLHDDANQAQHAFDRASHELALLHQRGRTKPIDDREPTQFELDSEPADGERQVALDEETFEQALERAKISLRFLFDDPAITSPEPIRSILNLCEFAAVLGQTDRALRDRLSGRAGALFPLDGPNSPVVGEGKRRGIDVSKLPDEFKRRLLPEQLEMIDQFCAVPMGSTRYGGRRQ